MAKTGESDFQIKSILGGQSPTVYFYGEGQFLDSIGIDPDIKMPSGLNRASGAIAPTKYSEFSGSQVDDAPMWIMTNPKNELIYTYLSDATGATNSGALISYTAALISETDIGTPTSGSGDGAAYYNNYIYLMTPTQVFRYGPLDGTPALSNALIANSELLDGWDASADTLLTNTPYPSVASVPFPSHVAHVHTDGALYLCDFINGRALIHKIKTTRTTDEGDTNDGSQYNVLDLPFGYLPYDIESYGTDLAIVASQTKTGTLNQGSSALFLWDTISDSFYAQIPISDPLATAIYNHNGSLIVFSGNLNTGYRIQRYLGGYSFEIIDFFEEGYAPFAGAVDSYGSRIAWGSTTTGLTGSNVGVVYALGYKHPALPRSARHSIARYSGVTGGASTAITSIKYAHQASGIYPRILIGWRDEGAGAVGKGLDSLGGTPNSIFRSQVFTVSHRFKITRIRIRLSEEVGANTTIVAEIYFDRASTTKTLSTVNSTNFTNSERIINYKSAEIEAAITAGYIGNNDFFLEFTMTGSDQNHILLPVEIWVEKVED